MSEPMAFDTHRFIKRLTESGMPEKTAEVLADEQVRLLEGNLATRQQLAEVDAPQKTNIAEVDASLRASIAEMDTSLRAYIAEVEAGLRADIAKVEAGLKADIAKTNERITETKTEIIRWTAGMMITQSGVLVALIIGLRAFS